jgi:hypothetical protein
MTLTEKPPVVENLILNNAKVEIWENGIVYYHLNDNIEVSISDSKAMFNILLSRYDGSTKFIVLVNPGRYTTISKEAREFSTDPKSNEMTAATAVLVKSLAQRLVINFIISFTRQQAMRMKMFDNRKKAITWLLTFKK